MTDRLDELWQKVKYLEDQVREEAKKRLQLEADLSELLSQLSAHIQEQNQFVFSMGEWHGLQTKQISELKGDLTQLKQLFHEHQINYST